MFDLGLYEDQRLNYTELSATPALRRLLVFLFSGCLYTSVFLFVRCVERRQISMQQEQLQEIDVN